MKQRRIRCLGIALAVAGVIGTAQAAGDEGAGKLKADTCLGCHGVPTYGNVYPSYHVPKVAGQHADYIVAALKAYKTGERTHLTMRAQAAKLTDEDMNDIAAYFAAAGQ
ncbi:MAG: c-type cytochrome [Gammaproteobacteria bacterium]